MPLPIFDTQDAVPEAFRSEYVEKDGKWHPKPPTDELGEKGKETLRKEREAKDKEKKRADDLEKERDELKRAAEATEKGITREALDKINADAAKKFEPVVAENAALKEKLRQGMLGDKLEAKLLAAGVMKDRVQRAKRDLLFEKRIDLTENGEDFIVRDAKGNVLSTPIDEFLAKDFKAEALLYYEGTGSAGGGSGGSDGGGGDGYDPVAAGKAAAAEQKKGLAETTLAFK